MVIHDIVKLYDSILQKSIWNLLYYISLWYKYLTY